MTSSAHTTKLVSRHELCEPRSAYLIVISVVLTNRLCPALVLFRPTCPCAPCHFFGTQELTVYPIARGRLINLAIFRARYDLENTPAPPDGAWVKEVSRAEMAHEFAQWEPEVQALLDVSPLS